MITEDYISFEIAKLLKEKEFVIPYDSFRGVYINGKFLRRNPGQGYLHNMDDEIIDVCSIQMVMKWLREVHNVNIEIHYNRFEENYKYLIIYKPEVLDDIRSLGVFYYYEEAVEEAIKYCLKYLIK